MGETTNKLVEYAQEHPNVSVSIVFKPDSLFDGAFFLKFETADIFVEHPFVPPLYEDRLSFVLEKMDGVLNERLTG